MKIVKRSLIGLISLIVVFLGYLKLAEPKSIYPLDADLGIIEVPSSLGQTFFMYYDRYTKVVAPNGKPIHILAQSDITNEQIVRSRSILEHYLEDYPGSVYGSDKSEIANKMADNNAVLLLLNGKDDGRMLRTIKLALTGIVGQPLYREEIQIEGHPWYTEQNYEHRDAAYEEILHLVHDYGIGVDGPNSNPGAAPGFQKEIRAAQVNGLAKKLWAGDKSMSGWIEELKEENSLSQEYFAAVIDTYYGLWGAFKERPGGMWGSYAAKIRNDLKDRDPLGFELMNNKFFHPYITYNARIDKNFSGTFSLKLDENLPYTHHARYLKEITLLGSNNVNVQVNELDNNITGNSGTNTVIFSGNSSEYTISNRNGVTTVADNIASRDGNNTLKKIEKLQFLNETIDI